MFVTGTDTGVGKTQVSRALLSLLADAGLRPQGFKPYESGCASLSAPADALSLREAAGSELPLDARLSPPLPGAPRPRHRRAPPRP